MRIPIVGVILKAPPTSGSSPSSGCGGMLLYGLLIGISNFLILMFLIGPFGFMFGKIISDSHKTEMSSTFLGLIPLLIIRFYEWIGEALTSFAHLAGNCLAAIWANQITPFPNLNIVVAIILLAGMLLLIFRVGRKAIMARSFRRILLYVTAVLYIPWAVFIFYTLLILLACAAVASYEWLFAQ